VSSFVVGLYSARSRRQLTEPNSDILGFVRVSFELFNELEITFEFSLAALEPPLRRDYLHVIDHLRAVRGREDAGSKVPIAFWEEIGAAAGLDEDTLRSERLRAQMDEGVL